MNDADAIALGNEYRVSYYEQFARMDPSLKVAGSTVPRIKGDELVQAMTENIAAARANRDAIKARMERATADGLFDAEALEATTAALPRKMWLEAIQVQHGDKIRCVAELKHWRDYFVWATRLRDRDLPQREPGADDE